MLWVENQKGYIVPNLFLLYTTSLPNFLDWKYTLTSLLAMFCGDNNLILIITRIIFQY